MEKMTYYMINKFENKRPSIYAREDANYKHALLGPYLFYFSRVALLPSSQKT